MKSLQAVRGMNDILPGDTWQWHALESVVREVLNQYGYNEIRMPILEKTELFKRSVGEVTDIVEKETYSFADRNNEDLTLRPEGTAGCMRAGIENGLFHNQTQRLWYMGPMFRHERPQKGRYRQFHQVGVEAIGFAGAEIDAEMLLLCQRLWQRLGMAGDVRLELNSLGSAATRQPYRDALVSYFKQHESTLDEDSVRRLERNPLRILDSKNPAMQAVIAGAPQLSDYWDDEAREHFKQLCGLLDGLGVAYQVKPRLVRGLDYYDYTVFEWVTDQLGAQGTVCAGGRYNGLVAQLGGRDTPAVGFALGIERLLELLPETTRESMAAPAPWCYCIAMDDAGQESVMRISETLRQAYPERIIMTHCSGGSPKSKFKRADKSGAELAIVVGSDELADASVSLKWLREEREQERISQANLVQYLAKCLRTGV